MPCSERAKEKTGQRKTRQKRRNGKEKPPIEKLRNGEREPGRADRQNEKTRDQTNKDRRKPPRKKCIYPPVHPPLHSTPTTPPFLTPFLSPTQPPSHPPLAQANNAHLQRPHPANPHLQFSPSRQALDVLELDALPPAAARRLAPEQQQLLRHADRVVADLVTADVGAQPRQRQRANDRLVGLARAVAPVVVVVEAAGRTGGVSMCVAERGGGNEGVGREMEWAYPAVNISIKCASVVPGSSLFLSPLKMPSWRSSAWAAARLTSIISGWSMSCLGGMT